MKTSILIVGIIIGAAIIIGLSVMVVRRNRKEAARLANEARAKREAKKDRPKDPLAQTDVPVGGDPRSLKAGDMVDYIIDGQRYAVRGTATFTEDGYVWKEHFLDTSTIKCYLSVEEEDGELTVIAWQDVTATARALRPGANQLQFNGVTYEFDEKGKAKYTSEETTRLLPRGTVEYYDYEGPDGNYLSFERFDGDSEWEISHGTEVPGGFLTIYPGSDS